MNVAFGNITFPVWHWIRRDGVNEARRSLNKSQWLSGTEVLNLQHGKLVRLLQSAKTYVPHYRTLLADVDLDLDPPSLRELLQRLPPLTKDTIRRDGIALTSENLQRNRLLPSSTSGSTGEATRFWIDRYSHATRRAAQIRGDEWTGWQLGDRYATLWGAPMDETIAKGLRGRLHGWVTRHQFLSSYDLSASRMDTYIEVLRSFRPTLLVGYPGPLEVFALHCHERRADFPSLKAIVSSAETLWPHQREIIERAFSVRVFNRYGSREFGHIASECEIHDGLHVNADRVLLEIVNDDGTPCAPQQEGRLLVTDLDNYGMPFIRYEIGDHGAWALHRACACGRGLPLLQQVAGRTLEIVQTRGGRKIGGTFWTLLLRSRPGLRQFQVIQDDIDGVVVRYVRDPGLNAETLDFFATRIREHCGDAFEVKFQECESIDLTKSGKKKLIISNLRDKEPPRPPTEPQ